ncbi:hypothetical protein THMIRHAS_14770 [Thiosulfatimonas sediminis]|uniref:DUF3817 domain-containing protein n=1 Tax=Thiosulfatimonas sediminis TaxID=2675054 RepID=A0A6F8PVS3_9GAMM|nr:DUF3817 domain-containing protein [Thiosulfatimonas sediminis]BBP46104.1 hypothetical protein THMIRHAS_14770 [Thiosulfatimonas sediminis]
MQTTPNFSLLKLVALLEGTSLLLLLLVAMPLKYMMGIPEAVKIIGPAHGVLFIVFNAVLLSHAFRGHLGFLTTLTGFVASLIPVGTFVFKAKMLKNRVEFA